MGWCRMMCDIGRRKGITGGGSDGWRWRGDDIGGYCVGGNGGCAGWSTFWTTVTLKNSISAARKNTENVSLRHVLVCSVQFPLRQYVAFIKYNDKNEHIKATTF